MPCNDCSRTESCPPCPHGEEEPKGSTVNRCEAVNPNWILRTQCGRGLDHAGNHYPDPDAPNAGWWPREPCQHPNAYNYASSGSSEEWTRYYLCQACKAKWETVERRSVPEEPEPPMTPEEEEQAPEDEDAQDTHDWHHATPEAGLTCKACGLAHKDWTGEDCPDANLAPYNGEHGYPPEPQPEQRPPYLAAYSVQGHLYEVALSGDATVRAVDGALVITHALGPVAGIVQCAPLPKEGA